MQGMQYTYLSAILTTLERKFGIKSKETAYLMSGDEIAQILFLFFMPLTVKAKKRPLWCGISMALSAVGLYLMSLPHLITGRWTTPLQDDQFSQADMDQEGLCNATLHVQSLEHTCGEDGGRRIDWVGLFFVFFGVVITGIGNSLFWCFGLVYLDDNTGKANSPFMLALTYTFKLIGSNSS